MQKTDMFTLTEIPGKYNHLVCDLGRKYNWGDSGEKGKDSAG